MILPELYMIQENPSPETIRNETQQLISEIVTGNGNLVRLCPEYSCLHVPVERKTKNVMVHLFSILHEDPYLPPDMRIGVGCTAISVDIPPEDSVQASSLTMRGFTLGFKDPLNHINIFADMDEEKICLKDSGIGFLVSSSANEVFSYLKTDLVVDPKWRRAGWGSFLIQIAAQTALFLGCNRFEVRENRYDNTPTLSSTGESLFEKALGGRKEHLPDRSWYIPLTAQTPTYAIEKIAVCRLSGSSPEIQY